MDTKTLDRFRLNGKKALVTGAATGLGAAIAVALAEAGSGVVCHGNRGPADATAAAIREIGGTAETLEADPSDPTCAAYLISETVSRLGQIDILVNNAGTILRHSAVDFPWTTG